MKDGGWEDCINSGSSIRVTADTNKAKSLLNVADGRILFLEKINIDKNNGNYIFEGYYTSVLETLQAIVIKNGYKVNNHVCLGFFLRDELKSSKWFSIYDDLRYKRNSLVYYGKGMELKVVKESIEKSKLLIKELKKINIS